MPGGQFDSSRTRVAPVFDRLHQRSDDWLPTLLGLASDPPAPADLAHLDLRVLAGYWGATERGLAPPVALLSWLIRHPTSQLKAQDRIPERSRLAAGEPATVELALRHLRSSGEASAWYVLEGPTYPDVLLETPDALVVIEGKRTEAGPTLKTKWLDGRHQIWRHIDAAWEIRGRRQVFGFFIVEAQEPDGDVPASWRDAFEHARTPAALATSFPHRSEQERSAIAFCFRGGTTWQRICTAFGIDPKQLPHRIDPMDRTSG